jgi:hypothetical protein
MSFIDIDLCLWGNSPAGKVGPVRLTRVPVVGEFVIISAGDAKGAYEVLSVNHVDVLTGDGRPILHVTKKK